ncbi:SDR family oxidoreductase [Williamsia deligens]|uniref:SDR family oxidoreductase n=1 Tax=Williamsia deligens TaxID=321325 RepID=A0ABW3G8H3_9NOCA|nr:SDR family oxidoreductase [Williamsia deligens]MCP2192860.1 Uncharacterized conserved protein YbjT, contains NAD(P)-binding and DUF2867 domains [Williamsia deligens]
MIVITGATGALNGATVRHLLDRVPASSLAVVTRDPDRAREFSDRGVEVRRGDYADPSSLPAAFDGADQLLLVSSNDPFADAVALHGAAVDAAVAARVGRVLYTSHQGAAPDSPFGPARDHAATESLLAESGLPWTSLRNGFYAHSLDLLAGPWRETGVIVVPADGPVSWTWREDSAEAAAAVLLDEGSHDGAVTLTAAQAHTFAEVASIASEVVGRPIRVEVVEPERWVADKVAAGMPEPQARFTLGMFQAAEQGYFAGVDPLLSQLLGRPPRRVREVLDCDPGHVVE